MVASVVVCKKPIGGHRLIYTGVFSFVFVAAVLLATARWWVRVPAVEPRFAIAAAQPLERGIFRLTIDARDPDTWVGVDFAAGKAITLDGVGEPGQSADLAVRRFEMRAFAGATDLGDVALEHARLPRQPRWVVDEGRSHSRKNPLLATWYRYSYWTHMLRSERRTFAIRRFQGGIVYARFVSYYCAPEGSGCVTVYFRLGS